MKRPYFVVVSTVLCSATFGQLPSTGHAQAYPNKAIRVIVPFAAGSGTDILARILTEDFRSAHGWNFVIDNRAGGSGQIAAELAARAAPDGYTLFLSTNTPHSANPFLFRKLNYDPVKDFAAVARLINYGFILTVNPSSGISTVPELLAFVKSQPGKTSYAFGNSTGQVNGAFFVKAAKLDSLAVPYKSTPPAMTDLIGGQVHFMFVDMASSQGHVKAGRLRAIGVMSDQRSKIMPDLPAVGETVPGFDTTPWAGFFVPAGTAKTIISRLSDETRKTISKPAISQKLTELGLEPVPSGPEELDRFVQQQLKNWGKKIQEAGIQPE
ncbi:MAG TPA: tripartite tricarboxylate transporter substrate-binding protein [Burkholderiales bacterium]|nr:tripartite tricarboxylate transporter substrate-binding protein [Burkholderiales bacterium]